MSNVPTLRPRLSTVELGNRLYPFKIDRKKNPLIVVGIRGYYKDSMGVPGVNDRGIYDDAIFLYSSQGMVAYNGNTDPSKERKGSGTGAIKGMAVLKPGAWFAHVFGLHQGKYLALVQTGGPVTVIRDGDPPYQDSGYFGINIHKGGVGTTGSEGCQTIYPDQWTSFISLAMDQAKRFFGSTWKQHVIPYILLEG